MVNPAGNRRRDRVVVAVLCASVVCVLAAAAVASRTSSPPTWQIIAVALGFAGADSALIHLRFGHDRLSFTWSEVVLVLGLVLLPAPWIVLVAPVGVGLAHLALRRDPLKIIFNAAVAAVGASSAWAAFSLVQALAPGDGAPATLGRLVTASLLFWTVTGVLFSTVVAASQNLPFAEVHLKALPMNLLVWTGNTIAGCMLVSVRTAEPVGRVAIPILILALALIYRGYLLALEERDTWSRLQAVSRELRGADADGLAEVAIEGALGLLHAEFADLVLVNDEHDRFIVGWRKPAGEPLERLSGDPFDVVPGSWGRVLSDRAPFTVDLATSTGPQHEELETLGLTSVSVAPLLVHGRCLGALRVGFRGPVRLRGRERQVLETFANHISAAAKTVQLVDKLRVLAHLDELTRLPNRAELDETLATAVAAGKPLTVLFLDLDRFKVINDSLGHHVGDDVLKETAARLRRTLPKGATAARFGGDEFVVVWPGMGDEKRASDLALTLSTELSKPIVSDGNDLLLTASVGVVVADGRSSTPSGLLRDADAAMYIAKERGRDRVELFTTSVRTTAMRRLELETELRAAMQSSEIVVHYQPIVDLQSRKTLGAEALLRWHNPQRGLMATPEFVALAEETGLIMHLGLWVVEQAIGSLAVWDQRTKEPLSVSINLSARQLTSDHLVEDIVGCFERAGADPARVTFEVTESSLVDLGGEAVGNLTRLRGLGSKIALDDFGTGWSSLSYLQRLPVDCLKLDRSFVARLDEGGKERAVVGSMVSLAHALDLMVVAEGVERTAELDVLVDLGCDAAQGFLLQTPCNSDALLEAVRRPGGCWPVPPLRALPDADTA
jgi:diguanylate cyclase (GGDEF)-like protein